MNKYDRHVCESLPNSVRIEFSRDTFHKSFTWQIVFTREATEEDLESNHYLENVGEEMWSLFAEITNCPYCGKKLMERQKNDGEFILYDSSGWSVNVL